MNTNTLPKQPELAVIRNKEAVEIAAQKLYNNAKDKNLFNKEMEKLVRHWGMLQRARMFEDAVSAMPQIQRPSKKKGAKK